MLRHLVNLTLKSHFRILEEVIGKVEGRISYLVFFGGSQIEKETVSHIYLEKSCSPNLSFFQDKHLNL